MAVPLIDPFVFFLCQSGSISLGVAKPVFPVHAVSHPAAAAAGYKGCLVRAHDAGFSEESGYGWWVPYGKG